MNENDTENKQDILEELINESPYETSPVVMKDYINAELEDINHQDLIEENETEVHDEVG